jgi:hypothetical protein
MLDHLNWKDNFSPIYRNKKLCLDSEIELIQALKRPVEFIPSGAYLATLTGSETWEPQDTGR